MPKAAQPWSLTSLREKLIKIGAKVVSHGRYVTFQLAEVSVSLPPIGVSVGQKHPFCACAEPPRSLSWLGFQAIVPNELVNDWPFGGYKYTNAGVSPPFPLLRNPAQRRPGDHQRRRGLNEAPPGNHTVITDDQALFPARSFAMTTT
jgi:hypothetical protein